MDEEITAYTVGRSARKSKKKKVLTSFSSDIFSVIERKVWVIHKGQITSYN